MCLCVCASIFTFSKLLLFTFVYLSYFLLSKLGGGKQRWGGPAGVGGAAGGSGGGVKGGVFFFFFLRLFFSPPSFSWGWLEWRSHGLPTRVYIKSFVVSVRVCIRPMTFRDRIASV